MHGFARRLGLLTLLLVMASGLAATAASACNNTRPNNQYHPYWDGMIQKDSASGSPFSCFFGAQGNVYTTNPSVLSPDNEGIASLSAAWVGLDFTDANGNFVLGQDGWWKLYNGTVQTFSQINVNGLGWMTGSYGGPANGSTHNFETTYNYSNSSFTMSEDGIPRYTWQYTPAHLGCNYKTDGEMQGEITSAHNQMPGTQSNPETIQNAQVMSNGGSWAAGSGWNGDDSNNNWFYNSISYYLYNNDTLVADSKFYDDCN